MTKAELVALVAERVGSTQKVTEDVLNGFIDVLTNTLAKKGDKVVLSGLGTFEVRTRAKRDGKNPRTGEKIVIPASKVPAFKAGKQFKDAIKG